MEHLYMAPHGWATCIFRDTFKQLNPQATHAMTWRDVQYNNNVEI